MGIIKDLDSRVSLDLDGLANKLRNKRHKSSRKVNAKLRKDTYADGLGKCFLVKTNVGIAPHNTRSGTNYLIPANTECIAVQMKGWLALYLTKGMLYDSLEDVMSRCRYVRASDTFDAAKGKYPEFRVIGMPSFRDSAKVAFKQLLPKDWANDADTYVPRIRQVYGM